MVRLEENKHVTETRAIEKLGLPARVYIPLSQHLGKICNPQVAIGDTVLTGQRIASVEAHVSVNIHASISGKVVSIQDWPHPVLGTCKAIVIESDGLDKSEIINQKSEAEIDRLTPEQIRKIVHEAGVVGMGGASFPTHIKLNPPKPVDTLIINGAECEPYLTSDSRLMIEKTDEILKGIALVAQCLGVKKVYIAIEDNKPEAVKSFKEGSRVKGCGLRVLKSEYPQGGEKQLIKKVLGREVPSGKLPFDVGVVVHNVATVYAIYEAVYLEKPLYERVVTVTGDCLQNPANLWVRIGTPLKDLIAHCGPLKKEPKEIILGGPMMGIAQFSMDVPVIKSTGGVILLSEAEIKPERDDLCIRCGRCVEYCPAGLMPCILSMASEKEKWDLAKEYGCLDCIECGLCSFICPQKRNIVQEIKRAKIKVAR